MAESKIFCPICHRKVGNWDGKSQMTIDVKCNKCNKLVVFYPKTKEKTIKSLPPANTAGGKRLY